MIKTIESLDFDLFEKLVRERFDCGITYINHGQKSAVKVYDGKLDSSQMSELGTMMEGWSNPVINVTGLDVELVLGSLKTDSDTIVADADKTIKLALGWDSNASDYELLIYEKTDEDYGAPPAGVEHLGDLKEYSVANGATELVEL